jgi:hypothetical protein
VSGRRRAKLDGAARGLGAAEGGTISGRRAMRRVLFATVIVIASIGLAGSAARADAPRDVGWWTVTNPGGLPAAPPAPPDVKAGDLLIQGGGGGAPTAYAALLYELDPVATAGNLTLATAPNSGTTPSTTLQVCQLLQPINHPEQGGPMSDAPPYNCAHKATAAPGTDGKYQFNAADLVSNGLVAVAILPTGPVDRVVLSAPDANSLTTQPGPAGSPLPDSSAAIAPTDTGAVPLPDTSGLAAGTSPGFTEGLPGAAVGPTSVSPAPAATPASPNSSGIFVPTVSAGPEKATPLLVVLFIVAGLGGVGLWLYAGRQRDGVAVTA